MSTDRYVVHDAAGPDLEFEGELVVEEQARDIGNLQVYRTVSGRFVARQRVESITGKATDRTGVFGSLQELSEWLGYSAGAKAVLEKLGHQTRLMVD